MSMSDPNVPFSVPGSMGQINIPFARGARRAAPTEQQVEEQQVSRFERATEQAGLQAPEQYDLEALLVQAGVDVQDPGVQAFIRSVPDDLPAETLQFYIAQLAEKYPSVPVTQYSQALEASGLATGPFPWAVPRYEEVTGKKPPTFTVSEDTGWIRYANGVLVNPGDGSVFFDPSSDAPGSPTWLQAVPRWDPDKVAEWRTRLFDFGLLTKEQAKVKGVDQVFVDQLRAYHVARYQNFGKALPTDLSAIGGPGEQEFRTTARDFQVQIRNDVREQYRRVFGDDPSDEELADWTRMVTQSAMKMQKRFERRGATPSEAVSLAATNAEERLVEQLETSPQAELLAEANSDESTRLRDALGQAARVSAAFGG